MIHLDTNFLIRAIEFNTPEAQAIVKWLTSGQKLAISSVAWCEFVCGPVTAKSLSAARAFVPLPIPFDGIDAALAASLFNVAGRRRGRLADCIIAAVAIREGAALATLNLRDFRLFESAGLLLV